MMVLHGFGPGLGLPDPSPFVLKAMLLLGMAGIDYRLEAGFAGLRRAPKGKLPYVVDDTTFIRLHIEKTRDFDFDAGLAARARAEAWAIEKFCEDHVYFLLAAARWLDPAGWQVTRDAIFAPVPAPLRAIVAAVGRRQLRRMLRGQGVGRHTPAERDRLGERAFAALTDLVGDKPFLMGDAPCGADATVAAMIAAAACPGYDGPINRAARAAVLTAYCERMFARFGR